MRILQISSAKTFGGGERHLVDLCRGLQNSGHDVFVALRPTNEWESRLDFIPGENFLHTSIRNSFGMFSSKRIGRFLSDKGIDIVHAHVARDYIAAAIARRISNNARFVLTRHVMFPLKPFHRLALRNLDAAIAVAPAVSIQLEKIFPREKIHVIPNGLSIADHVDAVELRRRFREFHSIPQDIPLVGTLGELKPLKGQRDFILAVNEVAMKYPECRFIIAGKDNSPDGRFRRELRRLVKVFGLEDRFLWLDWIEDTSQFYAAIDLFVSPSHSESFGLAILEAMARGTPVVAYETDGAKELLAGVGSLTPISSPVEMAAAIMDLLNNKDRRDLMGSKLRGAARERYSVDRMIDATEQLYFDIISNSKRSA